MNRLRKIINSPEIQLLISKTKKHKRYVAALLVIVLAIELIPSEIIPDANVEIRLEDKKHKRAREIAEYCAKLLANSQGMENVYGAELMQELEEIAFQSYYGLFLHTDRQEQYTAFIEPSLPILQQIMEQEHSTTVKDVLLTLPTYLYEYKESKRKRYLQNAETNGIEEAIGDTTVVTVADLQKTPADVYYSGRADCDDINGLVLLDFSILGQECLVFSLEPGPGHEKYAEFKEGTYTTLHSILAVPADQRVLDIGVPWVYKNRDYKILDLTTLLALDRNQVDIYQQWSSEEQRTYIKNNLSLFSFGDAVNQRYTVIDSRTVNNFMLLKTIAGN